jgi:serine/threonine-protein kinase
MAPVIKKPAGDPYIGITLNNRFKVEAKLGEGGFGAVYRGVQLQTNRKVAIKLLHPEMTRDENLVARFKREGLVLCNLRDAHTITTYDFDQTADGTLYIAMELLEGRSLHQVFHDEAPISWQRAMTILSQMCSSLGEAHAQGIVHRDLKPENVYLEKRGNTPEFVKILDFGIAKVMRGEGSVDPHAPQLTATGQTLGTLEYMSPEQLMGKQLDGRSDIYALGVLAYELSTGRLPFPDAKGPAGLITAQLKQTPKAPSVVNAAGNIPPGVDRILLKCLEKDKNNRFADVNVLARAVQDCMNAGGQWGSDPVPAAAAGAQKPGMETRKGELGPGMVGLPPSMPAQPQMAQPQPMPRPQTPQPVPHPSPAMPAPQPMPAPMPAPQPMPAPMNPAAMSAPSTQVALRAAKGGGKTWLWLVLGLLVLGGAVGAVLALTM